MSSLLISFQKFKNKVPSSLLQQVCFQQQQTSPFLFQLNVHSTKKKHKNKIDQKKCFNFPVCHTRTEAYCPRCELYICDLCEEAHVSNPFSKTHQREKGFQSSTTTNSHFVNNTRNRVSSFVNFVISLLVGLCAFLVHQEHSNDVKNVQESAKQCWSMLRAFQVPLSQQESLLKQKISSIEEEEKKYQTQMEALAQKIQDTISKRKNVSLELSDLLGKKDLLERLETTLSDLEILDPSKFEELKGCLCSVGIEKTNSS